MGRFLLLILFCSALTVPTASATTWHVNPDGSGDAITITQGINIASAGDTVMVACGKYYEHTIYMKRGVYLTSETGHADCVTIDGQDLGRILSCNWCDSTTAIVGFTLTHGDAGYDCGGAIHLGGSDIRVTNCDFHDNHADSLGGGVYVYRRSPVFTNCKFTFNVAEGTYFNAGGGACSDNGSPVFIGCSFSDNEAMGGYGAALYCGRGGNPSVLGCSFVDNDGSYGGGIACSYSGAIISGCSFHGNTAGQGGGLNQRGDSVITVTDCLFRDNYAGDMGGAFIVELTGAVFTECDFYENRARTSGGGGQVVYDAFATITDCVFAENRVTRTGPGRVGGAMAIRDGSLAEFTRCTMSGNTADYGGGGVSFVDMSTGSLDRCIIAFSALGEALAWDETGTEPVLTCCDLYGNAYGDWIGPIADQYGVNGNISGDPRFCDKSGFDFSLAADSPCLSADTCGTIGPYGEGCVCPRLAIEYIADTPNDHGGFVDISWYRDERDGGEGDTVIDYYSLWRRLDVPACLAAGHRRAITGDGLGDPPGTWVFIDSVAATGQATYAATCPTVCDSGDAGICWSVFFVRAHCPSPPLEFDSSPDSGYSTWDLTGWTDVTTDPLTDTGWGHGFSWADYDNDEDLDIYYTNRDGENRLYRNDDLTAEGFVRATPGILADPGDCRGVAWGDYDNDEDLDLYVSRNGPNKLFRNDGGGNFTDVTAAPVDDSGIGQSVSWVDHDNDGDVDLYLVNNGANKLFRNDGGAFTDVTSGPLGNASHGMGSAWADYDNDGDMDLYFANYGATNRLLRNEGGGVFTDVTTPVLEMPGYSMGVSWGDYDNDGDMDLYVTGEGSNRLLRNDGSNFTDVSTPPIDDDGDGRTGIWGDFDLDGDLDIYLVNSDRANRLFRNYGGDTFVKADSGACPLSDGGIGFSSAWGDYDGDGDPDLFLVKKGRNKLFRNEADSNLHWLKVRLIGDASNSYGQGARVRIVAGGVSQIRDIAGECGYLSQGPLAAHFGIGNSATVDTVEVHWPCGGYQYLTGIACDQKLEITENISALECDREAPEAFRLYANHPNPFSTSTGIRYDLPERVQVDLKVYDVAGHLVRTLVEGAWTKPGRHVTSWDGRNAEGRPVSPGIYFCRLSAGARIGIQRMVLLK